MAYASVFFVIDLCRKSDFFFVWSRSGKVSRGYFQLLQFSCAFWGRSIAWPARAAIRILSSVIQLELFLLGSLRGVMGRILQLATRLPGVGEKIWVGCRKI